MYNLSITRFLSASPNDSQFNRKKARLILFKMLHAVVLFVRDVFEIIIYR